MNLFPEIFVLSENFIAKVTSVFKTVEKNYLSIKIIVELNVNR